MSHRSTAVYTGITAAFFLVTASCSTAQEPVGHRTSEPSSFQQVAEGRWNSLSSEEQGAVCVQALEEGGPDYRGMLRALVDTGMAKPDATVILPFIVSRCV